MSLTCLSSLRFACTAPLCSTALKLPWLLSPVLIKKRKGLLGKLSVLDSWVWAEPLRVSGSLYEHIFPWEREFSAPHGAACQQSQAISAVAWEAEAGASDVWGQSGQSCQKFFKKDWKWSSVVEHWLNSYRPWVLQGRAIFPGLCSSSAPPSRQVKQPLFIREPSVILLLSHGLYSTVNWWSTHLLYYLAFRVDCINFLKESILPTKYGNNIFNPFLLSSRICPSPSILSFPLHPVLFTSASCLLC